MDEEFDLEEVVACSFVAPANSQLTENVIENLDQYLEFGPWRKAKQGIPRLITSSEFTKVPHQKIEPFLRFKKERFYYQINQATANRPKDWVAVCRRSGTNKDERVNINVDYRFSCEICISTDFFTVLVHTKQDDTRRFIAIDLNTVETVADCNLPADVMGDGWNMACLKPPLLTAVCQLKVGRSSASHLAAFDVRKGTMVDYTDITVDSCRSLMFNRKVFTFTGRQAIAINPESRKVITRLDVEGSRSKMQPVALINIDSHLVAFSTSRDRKKSMAYLLNQTLSSVKDRFTLTRLNPEWFDPDYELTSIVKLFKLRGHSFLLIEVKMEDKASQFSLLTVLHGRLWQALLEARFPEAQILSVKMARPRGTRQVELGGYRHADSSKNWQLRVFGNDQEGVESMLQLRSQPSTVGHLRLSVLEL